MNFPQRLIDGYSAFAGGRLQREQDRYRELAERGQSPQIMVIGCCDSRVSPEVIFDASPGELFVMRNVANIVPPYAPDGQAHGVSAALEFGVGALSVKHVVVLGHAHCGGVKTYAEDAEPLSPGDFIGKWMALMAPAASRNSARGVVAGRLPGATRAGQYCQQPRQPDDLPAPRQTDRERQDRDPRRLFRRRQRGFVGPGQGERGIQARDAGRRCVRRTEVLINLSRPHGEEHCEAAPLEPCGRPSFEMHRHAMLVRMRRIKPPFSWR